MDLNLLFDNLVNPALLFFFLGIIAIQLKSDLEIPPNSSKFISLYLLFSIGFKGGQELAHSQLGMNIIWCLLFGILLAIAVPLYTFFILKRKLGVYNAGAIAAAYGSVSAVTFITGISFSGASTDVFWWAYGSSDGYYGSTFYHHWRFIDHFIFRKEPGLNSILIYCEAFHH